VVLPVPAVAVYARYPGANLSQKWFCLSRP